MRRKLLGRRYVLRPMSWHTKRSLLHSDHSILDQNDTPIARVERVHRGCNIHCMQEKDALPVLLFALAIQKKRSTLGSTKQ